MIRLFALALASLFPVLAYGQAVDTTVCDVLKAPQAFNGKTVRIKATVAAGFDQFVIKGSECGQQINDIWLSYPEGSKAKAGPAALLQLQPARNFPGTLIAPVRAPVSLDRNKDFKQFDTLLSTPHKGGGMCLGCIRYEVAATLVGRLDATPANIGRDGTGKIVSISGFGDLNAYGARLVLQSVAQVVPHEIDYSKADAVTKSDSTQDSGGDPVAAAHKAASAFGPGNASGAQVARAADAYGKEGEDNGVIVGFSGLNEATEKLTQKGSTDSPDGVLYVATFDPVRMKGDALGRGIVHIGVHIADIRDPKSANDASSLYALEYSAWTATVLSAIASGQKTLTLPGGYLLWNAAWPPSERNNALNETLTVFLKTDQLLSR